MMKNLLRYAAMVMITILMFTNQDANAQIKTPAPSPSSKIEQAIGLSTVTVDYSRPSVKGRTVFSEDGLVPFGKMWRTGANSSTKITFNDDVKVEGKELKKGTYGLLTIPNKDSWTVVFYSESNFGGVPRDYTEEKDAVRVMVKPVAAGMNIESFLINFDQLTNTGAVMQLAWEKTIVPIKIEAAVAERVQAAIDKVMAGPSSNDYRAAANWYYQSEGDMEQALTWIKKANELDPKFWKMRDQAKILAKLGKYKEAVVAATKSMEMAKEAGNDGYVKMNKEDIAKWSKMK